MGLDNREYMRDEVFNRRPRSSHPWMDNIVRTLIIINVVVFLGQMFIKSPMSFDEFKSRFQRASSERVADGAIQQIYQQLKQQDRLPETSVIDRWMTLETSKVLQGQVWRLLTFNFLHSTSTIWHIFFNMWLLFLAGKQVAYRYGQYEFLWFYLAAGVFSALFYVVWGLINHENVAAVGASGAVSAVLVLYAMNWPHHRWYIYGIIPIPVFVLVAISAGMDLIPMVQQFTGSQRSDHIAHSAHIGGMLFGYLYFRSNWNLSSLIPDQRSHKKRWKLSRGPQLKVHHPLAESEMVLSMDRQPIPEEIANRVDEILEKISRSGESSLTTQEREFLAESSRRYRQ